MLLHNARRGAGVKGVKNVTIDAVGVDYRGFHSSTIGNECTWLAGCTNPYIDGESVANDDHNRSVIVLLNSCYNMGGD